MLLDGDVDASEIGDDDASDTGDEGMSTLMPVVFLACGVSMLLSFLLVLVFWFLVGNAKSPVGDRARLRSVVVSRSQSLVTMVSEDANTLEFVKSISNESESITGSENCSDESEGVFFKPRSNSSLSSSSVGHANFWISTCVSEALWWEIGLLSLLFTDVLLVFWLLLFGKGGEGGEDGEDGEEMKLIKSPPDNDRKIEDPRICRNFFVVPEGDVCESMISDRGTMRNQERGECVVQVSTDMYKRQEETNEGCDSSGYVCCKRR